MADDRPVPALAPLPGGHRSSASLPCRADPAGRRRQVPARRPRCRRLPPGAL